jgi:hypothetical protein
MARYLDDTRRKRRDSSKRCWTTSTRRARTLVEADVIKLPE